jgi:hypothetical protein
MGITADGKADEPRYFLSRVAASDLEIDESIPEPSGPRGWEGDDDDADE